MGVAGIFHNHESPSSSPYPTENRTDHRKQETVINKDNEKHDHDKHSKNGGINIGGYCICNNEQNDNGLMF